MMRVFLVVLDSCGIRELPDAGDCGDEGSHSLYAASVNSYFNTPDMERRGLFYIDGVRDRIAGSGAEGFEASIARLAERSKGKDATSGHWEIAGVISEKAFPTYPDGFPDELIKEFEKRTGSRVLCNKPYSDIKSRVAGKSFLKEILV